ncbi:hypothetical protein, partial [Paenirhodobacter populi]|uniref:hypothetical protein n=1 Tax=Paenirhodobacter populi TaxID=2306993 RepID=UPI0019D46D37
LEHILRQIEPDSGNLRHDRSPMWILAGPPWHTDAVGGRSHHQSPHAGETLTIRGWSERTGLSIPTIKERIRKGWPMEEVLHPVDRRGAHMKQKAA